MNRGIAFLFLFSTVAFAGDPINVIIVRGKTELPPTAEEVVNAHNNFVSSWNIIKDIDADMRGLATRQPPLELLFTGSSETSDESLYYSPTVPLTSGGEKSDPEKVILRSQVTQVKPGRYRALSTEDNLTFRMLNVEALIDTLSEIYVAEKYKKITPPLAAKVEAMKKNVLILTKLQKKYDELAAQLSGQKKLPKAVQELEKISNILNHVKAFKQKSLDRMIALLNSPGAVKPVMEINPNYKPGTLDKVPRAIDPTFLTHNPGLREGGPRDLAGEHALLF